MRDLTFHQLRNSKEYVSVKSTNSLQHDGKFYRNAKMSSLLQRTTKIVSHKDIVNNTAASCCVDLLTVQYIIFITSSAVAERKLRSNRR